MTQINAAAKIPESRKKSGYHLTDQQRETLEYMRSMIGQLSAMAAGEKAHTISYMLGMAHIETYEVLQGTQPLNCECPAPLPGVEDKELQAFAEVKIAQFRQVGCKKAAFLKDGEPAT